MSWELRGEDNISFSEGRRLKFYQGFIFNTAELDICSAVTVLGRGNSVICFWSSGVP